MVPRYETLPEWTYANAPKDLYSLAAAITLAGLENQWFRLTAQDQRNIVGDVRFGKRSICLRDGQLYALRKVCFGGDYELTHFPPVPESAN